jgi:hypothetical protein
MGKFFIITIKTLPKIHRHNNHSNIILCSLYHLGAFLWFKNLTNPHAWQCIKQAGAKYGLTGPYSVASENILILMWVGWAGRTPVGYGSRFTAGGVMEGMIWKIRGSDFLYVYYPDINHSNNKWSFANAVS